MKVYVAGKINQNDWRHSIFKGLRDVEGAFERWQQKALELDGFKYNGPYFISCDHGCYHGNNQHGRGIVSAGCGEVGETRKDVQEKCLRWIASSDIVFVWLDSTDAFGTFGEIGYAKALNKPIYLGFSKELRKETMEDMWFLRQMSSWVSVHENALDAWKEFVIITESSRHPEGKLSPEATERQLKYIDGLLRKRELSLNRSKKILMNEAGLMIASLKNEGVPEDFKGYFLKEVFIHNSKDVLRKIKGTTKKRLTYELHNYILCKEHVMEDIDYTDGEYFAQKWVDDLTEMVSDEVYLKKVKKELKSENEKGIDYLDPFELTDDF